MIAVSPRIKESAESASAHRMWCDRESMLRIAKICNCTTDA